MADRIYENFELRTERTGTVLPFEGSLSTWQDESEHRVNEHLILGRAGAVHQSNAQGPRRFAFRVLLLDDERGKATDKYKAAEATLGADPFGLATHPRFGRVRYIFNGIKVAEDTDAQINGLMAEIRITETGLRDLQPQVAAITARAAAAAGTELLGRVASLISRINNIQPPSVADLTSGSPLAGLPGPITSLISLGANLYNAVNAFVALADDATTDQYTLAEQLTKVGNAVETVVAVAQTALGGPAPSVAAYPLISQARLAYGQALAAYQLAARGAVPIIVRRVPGRMTLARFCQSLYGGGAQALEVEIRRLNRAAVAHRIILPAGLDLLVPDPGKVRLDDTTSAPAAAV